MPFELLKIRQSFENPTSDFFGSGKRKEKEGSRVSDVGCRMSDVGCRIFTTLLSDFQQLEWHLQASVQTYYKG